MRVVEQSAAGAGSRSKRPQALVLALARDPLDVDVERAGRRPWRAAPCGRSRPRRTSAPRPARARATASARRLVHRQHVAAVDPHAGHPVAGGLVGQRLGAGLALRAASRSPSRCCCTRAPPARASPRRSSRPRGTRPRSSRRRRRRPARSARSPRSAAAPGEARGVRDVRRDRHADRGHAVALRVPPAGRVAAPPGQHRRRRQPAQEPDRRLAVRREDPVSAARAPPRRRPGSPRGPRRSRTCRCGPGGGRRPTARRTCAARA